MFFLDPSILISRKNIDVRAGTEHVRSQCVEQGTYRLRSAGSCSGVAQEAAKFTE